MRILQTLIVWTWVLFLRISSLFHPKARQAIRLRRDWKNQLKSLLTAGDHWAWIHCASIGEYQDISCIAQTIRKAKPNLRILFTFQSPTGFNHYSKRLSPDAVFMFPWDFKSNSRAFLEMVKPEFIIFSRSEIWYHSLKTAHDQGIPTFLAGFRVTNSNLYFHFPLRWYYRRCFGLFSQVFCEDESSAERLRQHNFTKQSSTQGNPRIDQILQLRGANPDAPLALTQGPVVVAGSTGSDELKFIPHAIASLPEVAHWILVPHEVDEKSLQLWESGIAVQMYRWSQWNRTDTLPKVLLVDTIGDLPHFYRLADLAIVGGGFSAKGIHNILEPAVYGVPVATGPNHRNYPDALNLIRLGALHIFQDSESLHTWIARQLKSPASDTKTQLKQYLNDEKGASEEISATILEAAS